MKKKHFNIPVFITELACPFQCIYCDQRKISGRLQAPSAIEISKIISDHLLTLPKENAHIELAFFGGNFTGLTISDQQFFLELVQPYINEGNISGIRISTRPDYINQEILHFLRKYNVKTIELGAQSLDDEVLIKSKRGHTAKDVEKAGKLILAEGFSLGLQMMIGLPGDTMEKAVHTAKQIVHLGADNTRIYPALIIKGTKLEKMYKNGEYMPLSLDDAVKWSGELLKIFETDGVDVIKMGLHPSDGLLSGHDLINGPFHPSFRELVLTELWRELFAPLLKIKGEKVEISVPPGQYNYAIGYKAKNKNLLLNNFSSVKFQKNEDLKARQFESTTFP